MQSVLTPGQKACDVSESRDEPLQEEENDKELADMNNRKDPLPNSQSHVHIISYVCLQGDTCLKIGPWVVAPPWKSDPTESPLCTWLVASKKKGRKTEPGGQSPGRRGQTTRPANGSQTPEAPAHPTDQGTGAHTPKADKPGIQETFPAFQEQHTCGTSAPRFDLMGETLAVLPPPRVSSPLSLAPATNELCERELRSHSVILDPHLESKGNTEKRFKTSKHVGGREL